MGGVGVKSLDLAVVATNINFFSPFSCFCFQVCTSQVIFVSVLLFVRLFIVVDVVCFVFVLSYLFFMLSYLP